MWSSSVSGRNPIFWGKGGIEIPHTFSSPLSLNAWGHVFSRNSFVKSKIEISSLASPHSCTHSLTRLPTYYVDFNPNMRERIRYDIPQLILIFDNKHHSNVEILLSGDGLSIGGYRSNKAWMYNTVSFHVAKPKRVVAVFCYLCAILCLLLCTERAHWKAPYHVSFPIWITCLSHE